MLPMCRTRTRRMLTLATAMSMLSLLLLAQSASAGTASVSGGTLHYEAAPGEANVVYVTSGSGTLTLEDDGVASVPAPGSCTQVSPNRITCPATTFSGALGDGNDLFIGGATPDTAANDAHNDTVDGGTGDDELEGGGGADVINGGPGKDVLDDTGGSGDTYDGGDDTDYDLIRAIGSADGSDTYVGHAGDELSYKARTVGVTVDLGTGVGGAPGEDDHISGFNWVDGSLIAPGNHLTGDATANILYGGYLDGDVLNGMGGNDYLNAEAGADTISGGDGNDQIDGGGSQPGSTGPDGNDTIDGGPGIDTIEYYTRTTPVTVVLPEPGATSTGNGGSGEGDSLTSIENIDSGTGGGDNLTGNNEDNDILDIGGAGDTISALGGNDTVRIRDNAVDTASCGAGTDAVVADFNDNVAADCESVDRAAAPPVIPPPVIPGTPPSGSPPGSSPPGSSPPGSLMARASMARIQRSPRANTIFGVATIAVDGSRLEVRVLMRRKNAKSLVVGRLIKRNLKHGALQFRVKLSKKAARLARRSGRHGLKLTVRVVIRPPTGKAMVKTQTVIVRKGKAPAH